MGCKCAVQQFRHPSIVHGQFVRVLSFCAKECRWVRISGRLSCGCRLDIPCLFHNNALRRREPGMVPPKIR